MADKALLCGVNNYRSISDLRGCLNDLRNVRRLLTEQFGFDDADVRTLKDQSVTKTEVLKGWRWLLKGAGPGDRLVFHFSGHGSYTVDEDGDEEDGRDELLCLYDMDWDEPSSYLLDDDLRTNLTAKVPGGASLTVVLDSCHSGTGTRFIGPGGAVRAAGVPSDDAPFVDIASSLSRRGGTARSTALARDASRAVEDVVAPGVPADRATETVLVRFVEPPPEIRRLAAAHRGVVRSSFVRDAAGDDRAGANHVLLAGCRDAQTSADAYIGEEFQGAFSYHLCEAARAAGPVAARKDLIGEVRRAVRNGGFTQTPQLEPDDDAGPLFGGTGSSAPGVGPTAPGRPPATGASGGGVKESEEDLQTQLLREILAELRGGAFGGAGGGSARAGGRRLVAVHGICSHPAGYSDDWWAALSPHLPAGLREELETLGRGRREVLWSDLVTPRSAGTRTFAESAGGGRLDDEEARLKAEIAAVLEDRVERRALEVAPEPAAGEAPQESRGLRGLADDRQTERALFGIPGLDCVDDFVKYLVDDGVRAAVQARFREVVRPLLRSPGRVDMIAHSWGSVVAYEGLRALDGDALPGEVGTFFTVGAALSIGPVKRRLRPQDGAKPRCVREWVNLDAKGDPVGGPLAGRPFEVDREFLNLDPSGCRAFLGLVAPACAHSSYFDPDNVAVNRDVFARFLTR